jgi:hypothetical protein
MEVARGNQFGICPANFQLVAFKQCGDDTPASLAPLFAARLIHSKFSALRKRKGRQVFPTARNAPVRELWSLGFSHDYPLFHPLQDFFLQPDCSAVGKFRKTHALWKFPGGFEPVYLGEAQSDEFTHLPFAEKPQRCLLCGRQRCPAWVWTLPRGQYLMCQPALKRQYRFAHLG